MTLQQLQYFRTMATTLHYTKAASILHISQPSLSYALSQLEGELNISLFRKVGKQVFLTEFGERFKVSVENALDILEHGIEELNGMRKNIQQKIRLGYVQSLSASFIPQLISQFYKSRCDDSVQFVFAPNQQYDIISDLTANKLDIAFSAQISDELSGKHVANQELVLMVPKYHPFVAMGSIALKELSDKPMVMLQPKTGLYKTVKNIFSNNHISLNIVQEACDYNAAINYVSLGKGLSLLPKTIDIDHLDIAMIRIRDIDCVRPIYLLWNSEATLNPCAKEFISFIEEYYENKVL